MVKCGRGLQAKWQARIKMNSHVRKLQACETSTTGFTEKGI